MLAPPMATAPSQLVAAALACTTLAIGCHGVTINNKAPTIASIGGQAPAFALRDFAQKTHSLRSDASGPTVLVFYRGHW